MYQISPIAFVKNARVEVSHDYWGGVISKITLVDDMEEAALQGIEEYSHLEIIFYFDQVKEEKVERGARHPRNNLAYPKTGILAQRGKNRPNKLGLTTVKLLRREQKSLYVEGLDAVHGTPIIDIKPVLREFLPKGEVVQPAWFSELMEDYWKK